MAQSTAFVRYCPGDAIGSPASMALSEALKQLEADSAYLETMRSAGNDFSNYPHILYRGIARCGCPKCQPK